MSTLHSACHTKDKGIIDRFLFRCVGVRRMVKIEKGIGKPLLNHAFVLFFMFCVSLGESGS